MNVVHTSRNRWAITVDADELQALRLGLSLLGKLHANAATRNVPDGPTWQLAMTGVRRIESMLTTLPKVER